MANGVTRRAAMVGADLNAGSSPGSQKEARI